MIGNLERNYFYRWLDKGKTPARPVGKLWKFKATEVDEWIRSGAADNLAETNDILRN